MAFSLFSCFAIDKIDRQFLRLRPCPSKDASQEDDNVVLAKGGTLSSSNKMKFKMIFMHYYVFLNDESLLMSLPFQ